VGEQQGDEVWLRAFPSRAADAIGAPAEAQTTLVAELLDVDDRNRGRVPRDVRIAALESARELLSESEGENRDLAARLYLELGGALPPGRYAEGARLAEAALALTNDAQLKAVAHAFVASQRFHMEASKEAWAHVEAGLAAAAQLTSSDEPDRGDIAALELLAAVGFSDEPQAPAALLAALGLAGLYTEDRVPSILGGARKSPPGSGT
jgi:hypothetical protein